LIFNIVRVFHSCLDNYLCYNKNRDMDEKDFLEQLDKRFEALATKEDLKQFATKEDLQRVKKGVEVIKTEVFVMKEEWGEKIDNIEKRVNEVYNLADEIKKGIEKREQEFYSREAQVGRKLKILGEKAGIDISKIE